jgi:hypothetical protein
MKIVINVNSVLATGATNGERHFERRQPHRNPFPAVTEDQLAEREREREGFDISLPYANSHVVINTGAQKVLNVTKGHEFWNCGHKLDTNFGREELIVSR